jgi:hypothetical protein
MTDVLVVRFADGSEVSVARVPEHLIDSREPAAVRGSIYYWDAVLPVGGGMDLEAPGEGHARARGLSLSCDCGRFARYRSYPEGSYDLFVRPACDEHKRAWLEKARRYLSEEDDDA